MQRFVQTARRLPPSFWVLAGQNLNTEFNVQEKRRTYYPHIDGVRAIAVLSVLFYHVGWPSFAGGFVGVDIFFVISGYLITSHLLEEARAGRLRLRDFYLRRVRRLGPALLFTLLAVFASGALLFPPAGLERLARSTIAATLSVSNIFFWLESGYFDTDAALKPLLHTWSLGVEEQFYLFWPFLMLLAYRTRLVAPVVALIGLVSLVSAELLLHTHPSMAFFLTPFRMAEFAVGGLLAMSAGDSGGDLKNLPRELLTVLGLVLIGYAVVTYSHETRFPGIAALVPCVGAAALIYGGNARWSGLLLRNRLFVGVGLISYSLYLAHWSVIVFYRYWTHAPLLFADQLLVLTMSLLIGLFMYRYIERPFRRPKTDRHHVGQVRMGWTLGTVALAVVLAAGLAAGQDGWTWRWPGAYALTAQEIAEQADRRFTVLRRLCGERSWDRCDQAAAGQRNVLIMGDSHAPDGLNILAEAFPDEHFAVNTLDGCPPLVPEDTVLLAPDHPKRRACIELNVKRLDLDYLAQFDVVVLSVLFDWYRPEHLSAAIDRIQAAGVHNILVFGNFLVLKDDMTSILARGLDPRRDGDLVTSFALYRDELVELADRKGIRLLNKARFLCNDEDDPTSCPVTAGDGLVIYDRHHMSRQAATMVGRRLAEEFRSLDALLAR